MKRPLSVPRLLLALLWCALGIASCVLAFVHATAGWLWAAAFLVVALVCISAMFWTLAPGLLRRMSTAARNAIDDFSH